MAFGSRGAPAMRAAGGGSIVNVGSIASYLRLKCAAYVPSKTGLLGLTRTGAMEFVEWGMWVNAICPGTILELMQEHRTMSRCARPRR